MLKNISTLLLILLLGSDCMKVYASTHSSNESSATPSVNVQPSITMNGNKVLFNDPSPEIINGVMYVNAQFFEHPDIQADVYESLFEDNVKFTDSVNIFHSNALFYINVGISIYQFNDNTMDESQTVQRQWTTSVPYLLKKDVMVPLRSIAEDIGISVSWDQRTKTTILETDEDFRETLVSQELWEQWQGEKVMELDDPSGEAITEEEILEYIDLNELQMLDYKIIHNYIATLLLIEIEDDVEYLVETNIERLRNGSLYRIASVGIIGDDNNALVKRAGNIVHVGILSKGLDKDFTHFKVTYENPEGKIITYELEGKQGMIFEIPEGVTLGYMTFYGKDDYTFETYFW